MFMFKINWNDSLVKLRFKSRVGLIKEATPLSMAFDGSVANVSVQMRVDKIDYVYKWKLPWVSANNAIKKEVPFYKYT